MRDQQTKKVFSENLRAALARARISQTELAKRTRLSRDAISTYFNERSLPSSQSLDKIARALKTSAETLLPDRRRDNVLNITTDGRGAMLEARVRAPMEVLVQVVRMLESYVDK